MPWGIEALIADLRERQSRLDAAGSPSARARAGILRQLETIVTLRPRVVLLGESNCGKTSLANLLLEQPLLPDGVLANTRRPTILRYAQYFSISGLSRCGRLPLTDGKFQLPPGVELHAIEVAMPNPRLENFDLVDTPGLASLEQFRSWNLRTSDLLVWCTLATQAWKESERRSWLSLPRRYHRQAIVITTQKDGLRGEAECEKVRERLIRETKSCARAVVLASALGPVNADQESREDCGVAELEDRIAESLAAIARRREAAARRIADRITY